MGLELEIWYECVDVEYRAPIISGFPYSRRFPLFFPLFSALKMRVLIALHPIIGAVCAVFFY